MRYVRQLFKGVHQIQFNLPEQTIGATTNQTISSAAIDVYGTQKKSDNTCPKQYAIPFRLLMSFETD